MYHVTSSLKKEVKINLKVGKGLTGSNLHAVSVVVREDFGTLLRVINTTVEEIVESADVGKRMT